MSKPKPKKSLLEILKIVAIVVGIIQQLTSIVVTILSIFK